MRRDIIFFDLDGTLADSMPQLIESIVGRLQREHGLDEAVVRARIPEFLTLPGSQMFAAFLGLTGVDLAAMSPEEASAVTERYLSSVDELQTVLFPEVLEVIERLHGRGYTLFVSTNSPLSSLPNRLTHAGLSHYLRRAFGTGDGVFKGEAHYELAAADLDLDMMELAKRAVMVGDSVADIVMAREAGIVAIGRLTGDNARVLLDAGAHHVIADLRELEPLLDRLDIDDESV